MNIRFNLSLLAIGLEFNGQSLKAAAVQKNFKDAFLKECHTMPQDEIDLRHFIADDQLITTAISAKDTLVRRIEIPLVSEKDITAALPFQAETILPYPVEDAILSYQTLTKLDDSTVIILLAIRKETLVKHLESWKSLNIEPEIVSTVPIGLTSFGETFCRFEKKYFILHTQNGEITCILMEKGRLLASFAESTLCQFNEHLKLDSPEVISLQRSVAKMCYSLIKEAAGAPIDGIVVTGEAAKVEGLSEVLIKLVPHPLLELPASSLTKEDLLYYALPIGLGFNATNDAKQKVDFRQADQQFPHPWKRYKEPLIFYFATLLLLLCTFHFFSHHYLNLEEDKARQNYLDLLAGMNRSHKIFENNFQQKNPHESERFGGDIPEIRQLSAADISDRLFFLQKELQGTPDSFPLLPNIPRVSDVLAWLAQHNAVTFHDEQGQPQAKLQIENFNYTMVKRPQMGKKQEKYQVKIELDFSSPTAMWAREFHDALIAPNDLIDTKAEVKWNSNRGKYKTSFFLKDKTAYPGS